MTKTIGSAKSALELFQASIMTYRGRTYVNRDMVDLEGWKFLGAGLYRTAYLNLAENLVYKIGNGYSNLEEAANSRRLRRRSTRQFGFDLYIPHSRTYRMPRLTCDNDYVSVQEYAEGAEMTDCRREYTWEDNPQCTCKRNPCHWDVLQAVAEWSGLDDIHSANVLYQRQSKRYWLIDIAM